MRKWSIRKARYMPGFIVLDPLGFIESLWLTYPEAINHATFEAREMARRVALQLEQEEL